MGLNKELVSSRSGALVDTVRVGYGSGGDGAGVVSRHRGTVMRGMQGKGERRESGEGVSQGNSEKRYGKTDLPSGTSIRCTCC